MNEGLPLVVLADEEDRELPDGREVQRLVEDPLAGGAVAEEAGDDLVAPLHRDGERHAGRQGELAADDRRREDHAELLRRDVKRAALAAAVARGAPHDLGHEAAGSAPRARRWPALRWFVRIRSSARSAATTPTADASCPTQVHARGAELAVVTTTPGTVSQRNALRAGFSILYARTKYVGPSAQQVRA
jgi:hypothetical protein